MHKDETIFVVGNGPSLTPEDLDSISHVPSFAMNRIGKIFASCDWRPSYLVCTTGNVRNPDWRGDVEFARSEGMPFFLWRALTGYIEPDNSTVLLECDDGSHTHKTIRQDTWSDNPEVRVSKFGTSLLVCLQLAIYMGANRIVLLGTDLGFKHSKPQKILRSLRLPRWAEKLDRNHFAAGYGSPGFPPRQLNLNMEKAHQIAATASKRRNVEIINATRGGELETHRRLSLETCLSLSDHDGVGNI